MAYRRLPNTDNARLTALVKLNELLLTDKVIVLNKHKETIEQLKVEFGEQIKKREKFVLKRTKLNKSKKRLLAKLKLYVSHFLQVFNFAIDRQDISKEYRVFFKLETNTGVIPPLSKESDIVKWANNIVDGEKKRVEKGVETISHPNYTRIKELKEDAEKIIDELKGLEKSFGNYQKEIEEQRNKIDAFIKQIWTEIEFQFINEPIEIKRKKATQFGVVYIE
jgi:hypothetical protein